LIKTKNTIVIIIGNIGIEKKFDKEISILINNIEIINIKILSVQEFLFRNLITFFYVEQIGRKLLTFAHLLYLLYLRSYVS